MIGDVSTTSTLATEIAIPPAVAVERLANLPWLVWLDSSGPSSKSARYSYVAADPFLTVRSFGRRVEIVDRDGRHTFEANPWNVVRRLLATHRCDILPDLPPFQGGILGYFGYDLGRHLESLPAKAIDDSGLPDLAVGFYDWVLAHDHLTGRTWIISTGLAPGKSAGERRDDVLRWLETPARLSRGAQPRSPRLRSNVGQARYLDLVRQAKQRIWAGEIYQVNLSHRLAGAWRGNPLALYQRLREVSPVPHGAFLSLGDAQVLSASPERFLRLDGRVVETRPIKGTRPRSASPAEDQALAAELLASEKDRAENVMIVDLLRNDLGRVCEAGSIAVPELFGLEAYSNVWQLVSTVTGDLRPGLDAIDLLRACFPGGSVTGCPKIRAMEIIEELEPVRRGVYCGAIGYVSFTGAMDTSIVIRTLVLTDGGLCLQVGGAVVADSDPEAEYAETLAKGRAGLAALGATLDEW